MNPQLKSVFKALNGPEDNKLELASEKIELGYMDTVNGMVKHAREKYDNIEHLKKKSINDIKKLDLESKNLDLAKNNLKEAQAIVQKSLSDKESIGKRLRAEVKNSNYSSTIWDEIKSLRSMLDTTARHHSEYVADAKKLGLNPNQGPLQKAFQDIFKLGSIVSSGEKAASTLHDARNSADKILDK